jgi:predicted PurR-regulated permease PerM
MLRPRSGTAPLTSQKTPETRSPFWWLRWVPAVVLIVVLLDLIYILGSVALIPVLASFAVAYLLNPLVFVGEKQGLSRPFSVLLAMVLVGFSIAAFLTLVIPDLWGQTVESTQKVLSNFTPQSAARHRATLRRYSPALDRAVGRQFEQFLSNPSETLGASSSWLAGGLSGFLSTAAASLDLLLVPFFVYYILVDFGRWRDSLEELIPPRFQNTFSRLFDEVGRILESYIRGQLLIAMIMAVLYAIGFAALSVPAWAGIAALSGLLNAIPYVGTALGFVLATGFSLAEGAGILKIAGVVGVFVAVQTIEGYYLTPKILGERLSLHPMAVFLGLLIGGKLFGLLGVILAVPTIAVAKVFVKFMLELYKGSHFYHAGDIAPHEAPSEVLEERLADAADTVLAEQMSNETGEELLSPDEDKDDIRAREKAKKL